MNETEIITKVPYDFVRIWRKICMVIAKQSLLPPGVRCKMLKLGG